MRNAAAAHLQAQGPGAEVEGGVMVPTRPPAAGGVLAATWSVMASPQPVACFLPIIHTAMKFLTSVSPQGYNVRRIPGRGYIILAFFSPGYRVSVQDMQLVMDACPLRVDSMFLRAPQPDDASNMGSIKIGAVMSIGVLDSEQPVRITEAEVVRVRKRSRGLLEKFHSFVWD